MLFGVAILMGITVALLNACEGDFGGIAIILCIIISIPILFGILWFIAETGIIGVFLLIIVFIAIGKLGNNFSKKD